MEKITSEIIKDICRICLLKSEHMYCIYNSPYKEDHTEDKRLPPISEMVASTCTIKIQWNDGLPPNICKKCLKMVQISYHFQKLCNQTKIILDSYVRETSELKNTDSVIKQNPYSLKITNDINCTIHNQDENMKICSKDVLTDDENSIDCQDLECPNLNTTESGIFPENIDNVKIFKCEICQKSYKYSNGLKNHIKVHSEEKRYSCPICGKCFKKCGTLIYHKKTHSGIKPHACKECGKSYKQSGSLTSHMRIHTGQKPFLCSMCGKKFRQASGLAYHMRSHTKEKPYMCTVCGKTMSIYSNLVLHMRIHSNDKPFKCTICEKSFTASSDLKRHAVTHSNTKAYNCDVCEKSFKRMSSMRVHAKIHTDERPHVCHICSKGFIQAQALRSHLVSHFS